MVTPKFTADPLRSENSTRPVIKLPLSPQVEKHAARIDSYFHAKTWGEIFICYVWGNEVLFKREITRVMTDRRVSDKPVSDKDLDEIGWHLVDYNRKFIQKRYDKSSSDMFETYKYESDPDVKILYRSFTWDLIANRITPGWKSVPKASLEPDEPGLVLLSGITKELDTPDLRRLCNSVKLRSDIIEKTYVGYRASTWISNVILGKAL
jgi:hypothetical protein